jgi:hypothetical protein
MLLDKFSCFISKPVSIIATITLLPSKSLSSSLYALSTLVPGTESISKSRLCQFFLVVSSKLSFEVLGNEVK